MLQSHTLPQVNRSNEDWCLAKGYVPIPGTTEHALTMLHSMARCLEEMTRTADHYRLTNPPAHYAAIGIATAELSNAQQIYHHLNQRNQALFSTENDHIHRATAEIGQRILELAEELSAQQRHSPNPQADPREILTPETWWYIHCLAEILIGTESQRLADSYSKRAAASGDWNEEYRQATIATLQQTATRPPADAALPGPDTVPDPALKQQAVQARELATELYRNAERRYNESLPVDLHPLFTQMPDLEQQARNLTVPAAGARVEILTNEINPPGEGQNEPHILDPLSQMLTALPISLSSMVGVFAYVHQGRKKILPLSEINPYPKGFSPEMARIHAKQALLALEQDSVSTQSLAGPLPLPLPMILYYQEAAERALQLAQRGLHCVQPGTLADLMAEAAAAGLTPGLRAELVRAITADDDRMADLLLGDPNGNWRKTATTSQLNAILKTAQAQGLDNCAISSIAQVLGHQPPPLLNPPEKLTQESVQKLIDAANQAGVDPQASAQHFSRLNPPGDGPAGDIFT